MFLGLVAVILFLTVTTNVHADRRSYVWTYEYVTMPKAMTELEYYVTAVAPDTDESDVNTWKHWLELEYGITNNWDIAMYQMFKQENKKNDSDFEYDGFKIRTRYRIGEKNQHVLDTLLYLEYIRDDDFSKPDVLEGKIILAKDIGKINFAYNQIIKQELESSGETEHEYATGVSYGFARNFRLSFESKGNYTDEKYYIGPTISFSTLKIWTALGAAFGLNDKSDDVQARAIVGIPF